MSRALCHQARPLGNGLAHGSGKFQFISKMSTLQNQKCLHKYHVHSIRQDSETLSKYKQIRSFRKFPSCSRAPGGSGFRAPRGFGDRNAAPDPARTAGGAAPQPSASRSLPLPAGLHPHVHPTPQVSCETPARDLVTSDTPPGGISAPRAEHSAWVGAGPVRTRAAHLLPPAPPPLMRPLRPARHEPLCGQRPRSWWQNVSPE